MGMSSKEKPGQVSPETGRVYQSGVKGGIIEVRLVEEIPPELMPAPLVESDIMVDPWVEFPPPAGGVIVCPTHAASLPIDIPPIPPDEEPS